MRFGISDLEAYTTANWLRMRIKNNADNTKNVISGTI